MTIKPLYPSSDPTLDLNFAAARALDPRVTFTRDSIATRVGPDGLLQTVAPNVARFDHSPTTRESLGLLVEEARTNLLLRSEELATSPWITANTTLTNNSTDVLDPAGGNKSTKIVSTGVNSAVLQGITIAAASTASIWLRTGSGTATFDFLVYLSGPPFTAIGIVSITVTSNWQRFTLVTSAPPSSASYNFQISSMPAGTLYAWGAQLEAGAFATSYIPTTSATVTRAADVASITGANFSSWYNQTEGTVFVDVLRSYSGNFPAFPNIVNFNDGTANNLWAMYGISGNQFVTNFSIQSGGVGQTDYVQVATNVPGPNRIAQALAVNSSTFAANGALTLQDSSVAMPVGMNRVAIGADRLSLAQWGGTIRRLTYWPTRLPNAMLQAITS